MINLDPQIAQIEKLLANGDAQSLTYAALECRLAIERICYDRLRSAHDYISPAHLRRWQPKHIINTIIQEVDPTVTKTRKLLISKRPSDDYDETGPKDEEFVEIGTEIGFDSSLLVKLWNGLSSVALHVQLPSGKNVPLPNYGNEDLILQKVQQALVEIKKVSNSTMSFCPVIETISFECACKSTIRRPKSTLKQ